jgi:hypothetical protein
LKKIVITTRSIPIRGESIQNGSANANVVNQEFILSSYTPVIDSLFDRSYLYYNPTSQYRLVDILPSPTNIINRIDIQVMWVDQADNFYPLSINPLDQATFRIAFLNKKLYTNNNLLKKM